jgi:uncharacterized protein
MIADTSGLLALLDADEPLHAEVADIVAKLKEPLAVSPFVVAELDYLVMSRLGVQAELAVLAEISGGAFDVHAANAPDVAAAAKVIDRYRDRAIGLADAHQVVMARRLGTRQILTLDHRHFDVLRPLQGGRFQVLPG